MIFHTLAQSDVEKFMKECGVAVEKDSIKAFFKTMADRNVPETIKEGHSKLITMPSCGGGGAGPAATTAAAAEVKEEKKEEEKEETSRRLRTNKKKTN